MGANETSFQFNASMALALSEKLARVVYFSSIRRQAKEIVSFFPKLVKL